MMKPWFRILVVFISVSLLIIIFKKVDIYEFLDVFLNLSIFYYIIGILLILSTMFLFALRWKMTLKEADLKYEALLYRIVTSYFFNNLFLGVFGGDIYKALRIHKNTGKFAALFSVVYNRIINTYASAVFPVILLGFMINQTSENNFVYYSLIISGTLLIFFILIVSFKRPVTGYIVSRFKKAEKIILLNQISLPKTMLVSLLIQLINISAHYLFAVALGIDIGFFDLAFLYSVSAVIISIPVSINGIGVREGVFIFAFGFWGISAESALAFSFLSFTITIILSIIGGSIFVAENIIRAKRGK
jgi:glycosyltransferase 2 family protein